MPTINTCVTIHTPIVNKGAVLGGNGVKNALSMGKNEDPNLQQSIESRNNEGYHQGFFLYGRFWMVFSSFTNEFNFRCVFILFLSLSVLLPGIFWIFPFPPVHAYFTLKKPVSELVQNIQKLEYDIYEEIGVPYTKVAILSMHQSSVPNSTYVVFGVLPNPVNKLINQVSLSVLRASLIELFLQHSNLTLTTSIFGQPSEFEILKFPGGITITPLQSASILHKTQILFNFTLYNSISEIDDKFMELMDQLQYGLHLRLIYGSLKIWWNRNQGFREEKRIYLSPIFSILLNLFVQLTNINGSTMSSPVIVQASIMSNGFSRLLPQRLKQLAQTITGSPAKNLGLNNSVFGRVKSISLSSYLNGTLHPTPPPTPSPAPSPGLLIATIPISSPSHSPAPSPDKHHLPLCPDCKSPAPSSHSPVRSPGPGSSSYPTFPPLVSPAPSSAATHPPPPCYLPRPHPSQTSNHQPVMSPRSKLSPNLPPLPSVSYGSRPEQGMNGMKGPVSTPPAQSPSSIATSVLPKQLWLLAFLGFLTFHLHL
ncbi:vacuolar protein-sorting protein bro1-like isoform X1 [Gossypium australe]|uniref:Vacuolar protein-sorting protein bro1-like isoform X1 n=1 Tax=Gossypium australe TaxID=47621 RepID=A0A5B6V2H3_9ROSI|nr:vacuolar protein-sorting protein bro1-like isoform X1 [Gossypium australe]